MFFSTSIDCVSSLPCSPFNGTDLVSIIITNGISNYFRVVGSNLCRIKNVVWYPKNASSVLQESRGMILIDNTQGTFMIRILNNYLNDCDRGGYISFVLDDGNTLVKPVKTWGPLSTMPLWSAPNQGLSTG